MTKKMLALVLPALVAVPSLSAAADAPAGSPAAQPATSVPPPAAAAVKDQATLDKEFADLLTNASLTGSFTMGPDGQPKKDSYTILKAEKADGDLWAITAKVEYKGFAVPVEMRVPVKWAGDTPVISITDQKIPMLGTFTARVMFYGGEYAGTWSGGKHGGLMWGKVQKLPATKPADAAPAPAATPATPAK